MRARELQYCRCETGRPDPADGDGCPIHGRSPDFPEPSDEDDG